MSTTKSVVSIGPTVATGWLPDWSPWAVLFGLMALGMAGAFGLVRAPQGLGGAEVDSRNVESAASVATANAQRPPPAVAPGAGNPNPPAVAPGASADPSARPPGAPEVVEARQIVVQHAKSWKKADQVTRTKEEARKRCEEALALLEKGVPWDKVMEEYSDNPETKRNHGSLGLITWEHAGFMVKEPIFKLKVGERSPVTESPFGFHIYQRTQ